MINKKFFAIFTVLGIIIFLLFSAFDYLKNLPEKIDEKLYKVKIEKAVFEKTNHHLYLGDLKTKITWNLRIKISTDKVDLLTQSENEIFSADNVSAEISIIPLIWKNVIIKKISVENLYTDIIRNEDGNFNLQKLFSFQKTDKQKFKVNIKNARINAKKYHIFFQDKLTNPAQSFEFKGDFINLEKFTPKKFVRGTIKGTLFQKEKKNIPYNFIFSVKNPFDLKNSRIFYKGKISNIYFEDYSSYVKKYLPNVELFKGKLDITLDTTVSSLNSGKIFAEFQTENMDLFKKEKGKVATLPGKTTIILKGKFSPRMLDFDTFQLKSKDADIKINGKIANYRNPGKLIDLNAKIENSRIEKIVEIFPTEIKIKRDAINTLRKYDIKGDIDTTLKIKGPNKYPYLFGTTTVKNVNFFNKGQKVPKTYGKIDYLGKILDLDFDIFSDEKGIIKLKGTVSPFQTKKQCLNLDITSNEVELEPAQEILLAIRDVIGFQFEPVVDMEMKGQGRTELKIYGKPNVANVDGFLEIKNGFTTYNKLAKQADNVNGKLLFNKRTITYDKLSGYVEKQKLDVEGYTIIRGDSNVKITIPSLDLSLGQEFINESPLLVELKDSLTLLKKVEGQADTIIFIKGSGDEVKSEGELLVKNGKINFVGYSEPAVNINGKITFKDETGFLNDIKGQILKSDIVANGSISEALTDITLTSDKLNLEKTKNFILTSPALKEIAQTIKEVDSVEGLTAAILHLKGKTGSPNIFKGLEANIINAKVEYKDVDFPLIIEKGQIVADEKDIKLNELQGKIFDSKVNINGQIKDFQAKIKPDFIVNVEKLNLSNSKIISDNKFFTYGVKNLIYSLSDITGFADVVFKALPEDILLSINFNEMQAVFTTSNMPITIPNGLIHISNNNIKFEKLNTILSNSSFNIDGNIKNYTNKPNLDMLIQTKIYSNDIDEYINKTNKRPLVQAKGLIPISIFLKGNADNWLIRSAASLDKDTRFSVKEIDFNSENNRLLKLDVSGNKQKVNIENFTYTINNEEKAQPVFSIKGSVIGLLSGTPEFENLLFKTYQSANATILNPFIKNRELKIKNGSIKGILIVNGNSLSPVIKGYLSLKDINTNQNKVKLNYAEIEFLQDVILLKDSNFKIGNSEISIGAQIDNVIDFPLVVRRAEINSPYLNMDEIANIFSHPSSKVNLELNDEGVGIDAILPPFVIMDGLFYANEMIINNLITSDFNCKYNFTPDWILTAENISAKTAGGSLFGQILYNINSSEIAAGIKAENVQANALATTLLKLPNEVYGTLNGDIRFSTTGRTNEERSSNLSGNAHFDVTEGRLVRLGSLEYLLRASNILQCGITGLNLNNIIDLIAPHKTGYFDTLTGDFEAKEGIIRTDNTFSSGKNLSLFLSGTIDMSTNYSDITVLGRMPKRISGKLGQIGKVSINSFICSIPGLGFMPNDNEALINIIPGISKIPGLEIGNNEEFRKFAVEIEGDLYRPDSVKTFKWLD
ncbi:MAG: AsmA-like C-terminal region-containing protein [Candidatus Gastranaerophilales bacterium]|nr:AsmA-like C-terminal region-containing protein [Candidatus Gastranaerophilales bacterium]